MCGGSAGLPTAEPPGRLSFRGGGFGRGVGGGGDFAGEGNLLRKDSLPRAPTLLKLLGRRLGSIEGERLKSESSRSLAIFQQSLPLRFWGKGVWGRGSFCKRAPSPKGRERMKKRGPRKAPAFCNQGRGKPAFREKPPQESVRIPRRRFSAEEGALLQKGLLPQGPRIPRRWGIGGGGTPFVKGFPPPGPPPF